MRLLVLLALTLLGTSSQATAEGMAWVVSGQEQPASCISAVLIRRLDGLPVDLPAQGFELAPGRHSFTGVARLNTRYCPPDTAAGNLAIPPLEADIEADKTYYIGLDHKASQRNAWTLVIWKVEDGGAEFVQQQAALRKQTLESRPQ